MGASIDRWGITKISHVSPVCVLRYGNNIFLPEALNYLYLLVPGNENSSPPVTFRFLVILFRDGRIVFRHAVSTPAPWSHQKTNHVIGGVIHTLEHPPQKWFLVGCSPPLHATRPTPRGASRLVQAMSFWSVKTPRVPSRHLRDARAYVHTTTAMHDMSTAGLWSYGYCHA